MMNEERRKKISESMKKIWAKRKRKAHVMGIIGKKTTVAITNDAVRSEVYEFSVHMERKLKKRDAYGGWRHLPLDYLKQKLNSELTELQVALQYESDEEVMDECVDVANFVMFMWDIMRSGTNKTRTGLVHRGKKAKAHG